MPSVASAYTLAAGATLDLANRNQSIGSLAGAGGVMLGVATLTAGGDNSSTIFSGVITGTGTATKQGTGTLTLSGDSSAFSGGTTVAAGALVVDGSLSGSAVSLLPGAVLGGRGQVGAISAGAGATVAPGLATRFTTLGVAGDARFAAGS